MRTTLVLAIVALSVSVVSTPVALADPNGPESPTDTVPCYDVTLVPPSVTVYDCGSGQPLIGPYPG